MFTEHPGAALRVAGITVAGTLTYYMWVNYLPTLRQPRHRHPAQPGPAVARLHRCLVVFIVLLPFVGRALGPDRAQAHDGGFAGGFVLLRLARCSTC